MDKDKIFQKYEELVEWLNQECPATTPPLEPYTTYDLTHTFCDSLRLRLDEINELFRLRETDKIGVPLDQYGYPLATTNNKVETVEPSKVLLPEEVEKWIAIEMPINKDEPADEEINKWCRKAVRLFAQLVIEYHSQFTEKVSDEAIEKYAKSFPGNTGHVMIDAGVTAGFIEGAKAMRDGKI